MKPLHSRRVFAAACLVLLATAVYLLQDRQRDNARAATYAATVDALLSVSGLHADAEAPSRTFDAARIFVADHSQHRIDDAFYALWRDPNRIAAAVLAHARGEAAERPHLECSTRTSVLDALLRRLGYATRMIVVFDGAKDLSSHTFLEARNPRTTRWEIVDPDYDIHWRLRADGARAGIVDILRGVDAVEPCGRQACGWDEASGEGQQVAFLRSFLGLAAIIDKARDRRLTLFAGQVDPAARYRQGKREGTFCELIAKNCRDGFLPVGSYAED